MRKFFGFGNGDSPPPYNGPIAGNDSIDPHRPEDVLTVKHGANEYLFKYPPHTIENHALNIQHLREKCAEVTKVDYNRLNLICAGRKLTDDAATLKSLGVENGAKILCIGSNAQPPQRPQHRGSSSSLREQQATAEKKQAPPEKKKPAGPIDIIEAVREEVFKNLFPLVEEFISNPPAEKAQKDDKHRRLSETVMAQLLKLDSAESDEPEIRARRKEVVREIQDTLDRLDNVVKANI